MLDHFSNQKNTNKNDKTLFFSVIILAKFKTISRYQDIVSTENKNSHNWWQYTYVQPFGEKLVISNKVEKDISINLVV